MDVPSPTFSTVRIDPDVVWRDVDDELVLLNVVTGQYFGLNPVGGDVWRILAGAADAGLSFDALVAQVGAGFEGDPSVIRADLVGLLTQLAEKHLISVA